METIQNASNDFINYCNYEKKLSEKTIKSYRIDLNQFILFIGETLKSLDINLIDKHIVRQYLQAISTFKPKTIKRKVATIKTLFNYLEYDDRISVNPFRKVRIQIREPRVLPNVMTIQEVEKMVYEVYKALYLEENKEKFSYQEKVRDALVIELLFSTGVRVSELSNLKNKNIDTKTGELKIRGKGNKERIVQVCNNEVLKLIVKYETVLRKILREKSDYFLVNRYGKRLSEQSIRFLVKKISITAGINRIITPHTFRHSFATLLLEKDVDIKYIQHLLGHSSIMTTQIYTHVNKEKQRQILLEKHPRKNLKASLMKFSNPE